MSSQWNRRVGQDLVDAFWKKVDDATSRSLLLSELYSDVPPELDCYVQQMEFLLFPSDKRKEIMKWLNKDN